MNILLTITIIALSSICLLSLCATKNKLKVGDKAPNFALQAQNNIQYQLSDFRGKKIALYFYPKDNSPTCTQQACNIRDNFIDLTNNDITVIGISKGSAKSKTSFAHTNNLPFILLNATNEVLDEYGVNKKIFFSKRRTFLINENGIIIAIINNVDAADHAQQIINGFDTHQ